MIFKLIQILFGDVKSTPVHAMHHVHYPSRLNTM